MTPTPNKPKPSAQDEMRAAFEKAMNDARFFPAELCFAQTKSPSGRDEYANSHLQSNWYGWQAGAQWQASRISHDAADLISRLRASIAGKESFEEVKVFVANIRAAIQCLERGVAPEGWWAALNTLRDNLETFGPYGQETARVAIECCMDALEELDGAAPSAPQAVAAPDRDAGLDETVRCLMKPAPKEWCERMAELEQKSDSNIDAEVSEAPQPIAVPAATLICGLCDADRLKDKCRGEHFQNCPMTGEAHVSVADYDHNEGDGLAGRSRQPVPALSIGDEVTFNELLQNFYQTAYSFAGSAPNPITKANLISYIDSWAVQLVQQRATLSDEEIDVQWSETLCRSPLPQPAYRHFARAIITAAEAK